MAKEPQRGVPAPVDEPGATRPGVAEPELPEEASSAADELQSASPFFRALAKEKKRREEAAVPPGKPGGGGDPEGEGGGGGEIPVVDDRPLEEREPERMAEFVTGPYTLNEDGSIDLVFLHPVAGPIAFTASPDDVESHGRAAHAYALTQMPAPKGGTTKK